VRGAFDLAGVFLPIALRSAASSTSASAESAVGEGRERFFVDIGRVNVGPANRGHGEGPSAALVTVSGGQHEFLVDRYAGGILLLT